MGVRMGIGFQYYNGLLQVFKKHHNISQQLNSGNGSSLNILASESWKENVAPFPEQKAPEDKFNMDATALCTMCNEITEHVV